MKNKLSDLNNHLFAQLERLGDEDLTAEQIEQEAKRAEAIVGVSEQVISNANLQLSAARLLSENGYSPAAALATIAPAERKAISYDGSDQ